MRSLLLVFGQFACIGVLLFGGGWELSWWAWSLFALGLVVFLWATVSLGARNFTIMPAPRASNALTKAGIYRHLRHPMYTAVLICGAAVAFGAPSVARAIALAACLMVLLLKIRVEESLLTARHPDYAERMKGVARLLPGLW